MSMFLAVLVLCILELLVRCIQVSGLDAFCVLLQINWVCELYHLTEMTVFMFFYYYDYVFLL
ncbi:hypothetical protein DBV33_26150 [Pseudomonas fluorescens]|nr:hypothetical protein DBV33_26150 [Pseudomonas fluorescens]